MMKWNIWISGQVLNVFCSIRQNPRSFTITSSPMNDAWQITLCWTVTNIRWRASRRPVCKAINSILFTEQAPAGPEQESTCDAFWSWTTPLMPAITGLQIALPSQFYLKQPKGEETNKPYTKKEHERKKPLLWKNFYPALCNIYLSNLVYLVKYLYLQYLNFLSIFYLHIRANYKLIHSSSILKPCLIY